jgi:hypothetical protein
MLAEDLASEKVGYLEQSLAALKAVLMVSSTVE